MVQSVVAHLHEAGGQHVLEEAADECHRRQNHFAGFMGGGVLLVVYGTLRYWGALSDVWRTIMLGVSLAVLVWVAYKKLK